MRELLKKLLNNEISLEECENKLKAFNIQHIDDIANLDSSREIRTGFPEAILAISKEYDDLFLIIKNYFEKQIENKAELKNLIITKLSEERYIRLHNDLKYIEEEDLYFDYNKRANVLIIKNKKNKEKKIYPSKVGIITGGTSDINIAEEAKMILEESGCEVLTSYDVGVAGVHRLFPQIATMVKEDVKVLIVCAGMEGALPSVVAGIVDIPVIAVPTSVGYGVGEGGIVAVLSMLQACAPGISVVNIDNGFGAAVFALTIIKTFNEL